MRHRVGGRLPLDFVFAREATPTPDEQLVRFVSGSGLCVPGSFTVCFAAHVRAVSMEPQIGIQGRGAALIGLLGDRDCFNGAPDRNPGKGFDQRLGKGGRKRFRPATCPSPHSVTESGPGSPDSPTTNGGRSRTASSAATSDGKNPAGAYTTTCVTRSAPSCAWPATPRQSAT